MKPAVSDGTIAAHVRPSGGSRCARSASRPATPPSSRIPIRSTTGPARSGRCSSGRTTAFPAPPGTPPSPCSSRTADFGRELPDDLKPARPAHLADFYAHRRPLDARPRAAGPHPAARPGAARLHLAPNRRARPRYRRPRPRPDRPLRRPPSPTCCRPSPSACRSWSSPGCSACPRTAPTTCSPGRTPWSRSTRRAATAPSRTAPTPPPAPSPLSSRDHVAERRRRPADDLITELIAAEAAGDRLDADELVATCVLLLNAGHEATVHAIGNGVAAILAAGRDPAAPLRHPRGDRRDGRGDPALRPAAAPLHPLRPRGRRTPRPPLQPRRHRRLPARRRQPRPGRASRTRIGSIRPGRPAHSSPSAPASTSASARRSPASSSPSPCRSSSPGCPTCGSPRRRGSPTATTSAASRRFGSAAERRGRAAAGGYAPRMIA